MAETYDLTAPIANPARASITITRIIIEREPVPVVLIQWRDNANVAGSATYNATTTPTGQALITALNTANLTANSLIKRVMTRLQTDGKIPAGAITGTAE